MIIKVLAITLLVPFSLYTAFTMSIAEQSLLQFGYQLVSNPFTAQVVLDLYIMALLALIWMYNDVRKRSKTLIYWLPFALLTLIFVSVGPLLYLILRPSKQVVDI